MWLFDYQSPEDNPCRDSSYAAIVHMSYVDNLPRWSYPWHYHDYCEIGFITDGSGSVSLANAPAVPVRAGSIVIIQDGILHKFTAGEQEHLSYYTLRFGPAGESCPLVDFFRNQGSTVADGLSYLRWVRETLNLLINIHNTNGGHADAAFQSIACGLLRLVQSLCVNDSMLVRLDEHYSASDILEYLNHNQAEHITLDSLARRFNVSASHLNRTFNRAYHTSPINYLIDARVTFATEYLLKSDYSVAKIAELCGYDNPTHFANMFAKRIGCTPTEYRERNQKPPVNPEKDDGQPENREKESRPPEDKT
jgi:AraC-like DNA-binding protein